MTDKKQLRKDIEMWDKEEEENLHPLGKSKFNPNKIVENINAWLKTYIKNGDITKEEGDALRHYFGMGEIAEVYGTSVASFLGDLNELNIIPWRSESKWQEHVDILNNNKALAEVKSGTYNYRSSTMTAGDLKSILKRIYVPPPEDMPIELQKLHVENETWNKSDQKEELEARLADIENENLERIQSSNVKLPTIPSVERNIMQRFTKEDENLFDVNKGKEDKEEE